MQMQDNIFDPLGKRDEAVADFLEEEAEEKVDLLDIITDPDNTEDIDLVTEDGRTISFQQVATIPHDDKIYCLLAPLYSIDGVEDDEAIVFRLVTNKDGSHQLEVETDESISMTVFDKYLTLFDAEDPLEEDNIY